MSEKTLEGMIDNALIRSGALEEEVLTEGQLFARMQHTNKAVRAELEDTGERRRITDGVCKHDALELIASLAYEKALAGGDGAVIAEVERAILKLRTLTYE